MKSMISNDTIQKAHPPHSITPVGRAPPNPCPNRRYFEKIRPNIPDFTGGVLLALQRRFSAKTYQSMIQMKTHPDLGDLFPAF
jgi:hypothetical protein